MRKISLESIVFYRSSKDKDKLMEAREENFKKLFDKLLRNTKLEKRLNFQALWILNSKLIEPFKVNGRFEVYPTVGFIGYISETIK